MEKSINKSISLHEDQTLQFTSNPIYIYNKYR